MSRYAFLVDTNKCIGCRSCVMACKNYFNLPVGMLWREVYPLEEQIYPQGERAFMSLACNHCEHPACLEACPTSSYTKREDGVVVHNQETCIGCGNCIRSCPYGAPRFNEEAHRAEKCSLCAERLDAQRVPTCVHACLTQALTLVDLDKGEPQGAVQYPAGYPQMPQLNPGTRFILPRLPEQVGGDS